MPDWLIERGIGETRAVLAEGGEILEARVLLDGAVGAGSIVQARLSSTGSGGRNAVAIDDSGVEYLLPRPPSGISEGAKINIEVARESIPGKEPWKRPSARMTEGPPGNALALDGTSLPFPGPRDRLAELGWWDLIDEARSGVTAFPGGELRVSVTPAMTLIDVDGSLGPKELALAAATASARAIRRHGIGGSIGIDFPTVQGKPERQAIGEAIDASLPQPFERTAVNGFGFLQIVRPRRRASLFELATDRVPFEARQLLRCAAFATGSVRLAAHPLVAALLETRHDWLDALARQTGGAVRLRADPTLPISGGHVEHG